MVSRDATPLHPVVADPGFTCKKKLVLIQVMGHIRGIAELCGHDEIRHSPRSGLLFTTADSDSGRTLSQFVGSPERVSLSSCD